MQDDGAMGSSSLGVVLSHRDGSAQVKLLGELDHAGILEHARELRDVVNLRSKVNLDLSEVRFIDSAGIAFLIRLARMHDGSFEINNVSQRVRVILRVCGLESFFGLTESDTTSA